MPPKLSFGMTALGNRVSQKIATFSDHGVQLINCPLCPTEHLCEFHFYLAWILRGGGRSSVSQLNTLIQKSFVFGTPYSDKCLETRFYVTHLIFDSNVMTKLVCELPNWHFMATQESTMYNVACFYNLSSLDWSMDYFRKDTPIREPCTNFEQVLSFPRV